MTHDLFLSSTGRKVDIRFTDDVYRTKIHGIDYCAASFEAFVDAVRVHHAVQTDDPNVKPTQAQILRSILSDSDLLEERQEALLGLTSLSDSDTFAKEAVDSIKSRQASLSARCLMMMFKKPDFAYVTPIEISENVYDTKERSELLLELSKRVRL